MKLNSALFRRPDNLSDQSRQVALDNSASVATSPQPLARILIVEDDENIVRLLQLALMKDGYDIITASNGIEALQIFAANPVDMVLLDINMPKMDGYHVCAELRKHTWTPIVFITGLSRIDELVMGLELGADSYITKPFTVQEVRARIRALFQRVQLGAERAATGILRVGDIELDEDKFEVFVRGDPVKLTPSEFRLLRYLMRNPDKLISKENFLTEVWDYQTADDVNFIRVTIRRLRSKIEEDPTHPRYLKTVHGVGYQFNSQ